MLPPIKIKILERDKDMSLSNIAPIKIRIKEIKDSGFYHTESTPIKIKICDRNKNMEQSYENKQAKVREKNGKIVIKNKKDILDTDQILEYLSNDYIKPIRIKISTLNLVYDWLYDLWLKFNFSALIQAKYISVVSYGKFVAKLFSKAVIFQTFSTFWGRPRFTLKLKHAIELALDIFKVEGLHSAIKFKQIVTGFTKITEYSLPPIRVITDVPEITDTIIYDITPKTIEDILGTPDNSGGKLGQFILGQSKLSNMEWNTIEDIISNDDIHGLLYKKTARIE